MHVTQPDSETIPEMPHQQKKASHHSFENLTGVDLVLEMDVFTLIIMRRDLYW